MQNAVSRTLIVVFGLLLLLGPPQLALANEASELLVTQGRGQLFNSGDMTVSGILQSRDTFALAVAADGEDQEAQAFYGFTHALAFMFEDGTNAGIDNLGELLEAFGVTRTANDGIDLDLFNDLPLHDNDYDPPQTLPDGADVRAFVQGPLLTRLDEVLTALDSVRVGFSASVSAAETGDEPLAIDDADIQVVRSWVHAARTFALIISAFDLSCDLNDIVQLLNADMLQFQRDLLDRYPTLLQLRPEDGAGAENLTDAEQALRSAIDNYHGAHDFIVERIETDGDWRADHLFYFDSLAEANASAFYVFQLEEIRTSLDEGRAARLESSEQNWLLTEVLEGGGSGQSISMDLEMDAESNVAYGEWHGPSDHSFIWDHGQVQDVDIDGTTVTILLSVGDDGSCGDVTFTGTIGEDGASIIDGTYSGSICSEPVEGDFTGTLVEEDTLTDVVDATRIFGTGSATPLDIRAVLPDFNAFNEPVIGTFPGNPILNGILPTEPQIISNDDATRQFELMPGGPFDIPTAAIAIDGSFSDWPETAKVFDDISQDDPEKNYDGNEDLKSFWMAQDDTYYYFRTVYYDGAASSGASPYIFFAANEHPQRDYWNSPPPTCHVYPNPDGGGAINAGKYSFTDYVGVEHIQVGTDGADACVEWRVPKTDFEDLSGRFIELQTGYDDYNRTFVQFPGYTITGEVDIDGYTDGKVFLLLYNGEDPDYSMLIGSAVIDGPGAFSIDGMANMEYSTCYLYALWDRDGNGIVSYDDMFGGTEFLINDDVVVSGPDLAVDQTIDFSVEGGVWNVHQPDGSFATYLDVYVNNFDHGILPEDIDNIEIEGPGGVVATLDHPDMEIILYENNECEFFLSIPGQPEPGEYTFTVTSGSAVRVSTDFQYVIQTIPAPDTAAFSPAEGAVVAGKTPIFTWEPVDMPGVPLYYRFEVVDDTTGQRVWASDRSMGMTDITLWEGLLAPGGSYRWRVRVTDSGNWLAVQNRANSAWVHFTVPTELDAHDALPAIHPNEWNGLSWIGGDAFACSVKVVDLDGVAVNGSSHTLMVTPPEGNTFPDGTDVKYASFDGAAGPTACYFWLHVGGGIPVSGEYTFTVTDPEDHSVSFVEQVDVNPLDGPDEASLTPSNIDHFITAVFDDVYVNGQPYEDFDLTDISQLDSSRWKGVSEAAIVDNKLMISLEEFVGRAHGGISFADIEPITSVAADVTVIDISDNRAKARIAGAFFNDGSNADFWFSISNDGTRVYYSVSKQWFNGQGNYQWEDVQSGDLVAAALNDVVTVGVSWNEGAKTLSFSATNQTQGLTHSEDYVHVGPVYPPINKELNLQARINLTTNTTPTFTWDPVANASRYRVRIFTYDNSQTVWKGYTGTETSVTVPPGVLEPDSYYRYRVEAWDKPSPLGIDNFGRTPISSSDYYRFYTNSEVPETPYIDLDGGGVQTVQSDEPGVIPTFWVRVNDRQGVPGNIASVKVRFPITGHEEFLYLDHTDGPYRGYYHTVSEQPLEAGTYTFTVTDEEGHTATVSDDLVISPIGYPLADSLTATVGPDDIQVSWGAVDGAGFYRLEIYNEAYQRIHRFAVDAADGPSFAIPRGLLEDGRLYRYRIKTYREFYSDITGDDTEGNNDNSSQIPWRSSQYPTFMLSPITGGAGTPDIDMDNQGVYVSHAYDPVLGQDAYVLAFLVKVTDADGVPGNIDRVHATLPDDRQVDLTFDESLSDTQGYYYADLRFTDIDEIVLLEGDYTFTVADRDNPPVTSSPDSLSGVAANMLATPANLSPAADALLDSTTPTLSWDAVAGADYYRVRIFTSWHSTLYRSDYLASTATSWEVPYGVLAPHTTYAYRVYAYRGNYPAEDLDFSAFNLLYYSWHPHFTVSGDPDSDADGLSDTLEASMCTQPDDADSDDDGILDGIEYAGETNPCNADSDDDGIQDGTESGLTDADIGPDTDPGVFVADADPYTVTDPTLADSDGDGTDDGDEDTNHNGRVDAGESDPNEIEELAKPLPFIPLLLLGD